MSFPRNFLKILFLFLTYIYKKKKLKSLIMSINLRFFFCFSCAYFVFVLFLIQMFWGLTAMYMILNIWWIFQVFSKNLHERLSYQKMLFQQSIFSPSELLLLLFGFPSLFLSFSLSFLFLSLLMYNWQNASNNTTKHAPLYYTYLSLNLFIFIYFYFFIFKFSLSLSLSLSRSQSSLWKNLSCCGRQEDIAHHTLF